MYPELSSAPSHPQSKDQSFWRDVAEDLSIPTSFKLTTSELPEALLEGVLETTQTSGRKSDVNYSRTLDKDEKRGVWALLGLLAGSWVVAGFLVAPPRFVETTESVIVEKTSDKH